MSQMLRRANDALNPLSVAEEEMVRNAGPGRKTDCDGFASNTIRPEVLVWLCTDRWAKTRVARTGLDIQNAKLTGDLNRTHPARTAVSLLLARDVGQHRGT